MVPLLITSRFQVIFMIFLVTGIMANESGFIPKVHDGWLTRHDAAPYAVAVFRECEYLCMYTIISTKSILGTASCIIPYLYDPELYGFVGRISIHLDYYTEVLFDKFTIHESYDISKYEYDIAIITLQTELVFAPQIERICIAKEGETFDSAAVIMYSWGEIDRSRPTYANLLLMAELTVTTLEECKNYWRMRNIAVTENHICTLMEPEMYTCRGDAGAPIVYKTGKISEVLVGIHMYTGGDSICGEENPIEINTAISKFSKWIAKHSSGDICFHE